MIEEIEKVRELVKARKNSVAELAAQAGVNPHWLSKFVAGKVPGTSTKGLGYIQALKAYFSQA